MIVWYALCDYRNHYKEEDLTHISNLNTEVVTRLNQQNLVNKYRITLSKLGSNIQTTHHNMGDQFRLNFSNENLLEEGVSADNRIVYYPGHDYLSLVSPLSLLDPNYLHILRRYVQSRPQSIRQSVSNFYRKHRPRRKKKSREETLREFEAIYHRFWRLQIWVGLLFVFSIGLIISLVLIHPRLRAMAAQKGDDLFVGDGGSKSFQLCTKCEPLTSMKGIPDYFIADIKSSSHREFCCFRRVDQVLSLFTGYAETYVDLEIQKVREEAKGNLSSVMANMLPRPFPLVHVYYKVTTPTESNEVLPLKWETRGTDVLLQGKVKLPTPSTTVTVPETGFYFIYSSLELKGNTSHVIMHDDMKLLSKDAKGGNSELQGVFRLSKNDKVSVLASNISAGRRSNYFGIYLL